VLVRARVLPSSEGPSAAGVGRVETKGGEGASDLHRMSGTGASVGVVGWAGEGRSTCCARQRREGARGVAVGRLAMVGLALCVPYAGAFVTPAQQQQQQQRGGGATYVLNTGAAGGRGRQAALTRRRSVMPEAPPSEKRGVRGAKSAE
jgi:hypothetical protein